MVNAANDHSKDTENVIHVTIQTTLLFSNPLHRKKFANCIMSEIAIVEYMRQINTLTVCFLQIVEPVLTSAINRLTLRTRSVITSI